MVQIIRREPGKPRLSLEERYGNADIEAMEYSHKELVGRVAIFDTETDPFKAGRVVEPFSCGFYLPDTGEYFDWWGDDCIDRFALWLAKFPEETFTVFAHNGGNFDFYFLTDYFDSNHAPFIINGRLVKVQILGQEFRDSYAMIPVALGEYEKTPIDYDKFEKPVREQHKKEILAYLKDDCIFLGELVTNWLDMFGNKLTMASVALPMLRSYHGFETMSPEIDFTIRPYYFGGRNQCFTTGILKGDFKIYDINSSYPNVMKRFNHPISSNPHNGKDITDKTHFAHIRAWSLGALPIRGKHGDLVFPIGTNDFFACMHEIRAGLETKTLRIDKVYSTVGFTEESNFAEFIDEFYELRMKAKREGDKIKTLFYKLVMNSSYGKFAQDPRKYENWLFDPDTVPTPSYCGECHEKVQLELPYDCVGEGCSPHGWMLKKQHNGVDIYASPQRIRGNSFFNVATAASITSAARASLLRGIQSATRPVYCDTDSIICERLEGSGIVLDANELGAWDIEAEGDTLALAGKKLYALWNDGEPIKKASKGVKLTADEIMRVANGEIVSYENPVPKFHLGAEPSFVTRRIQATG